MVQVLEAGEARVEIDAAAGGRLASLRVYGLDLLVGRDADPLRWGCYPMAPFAGRVRKGRFRFGTKDYSLALTLPPHAIHGTVWRRPWRVLDTSGEALRLEIDLGPGWPFPGRAVQAFRLSPDALDLRLEVHAVDVPFPASAGWHPWFRRDIGAREPLELDLPARAMYVRDAEGIPTGEKRPPTSGPWDDCFTDLEHPPVLRWPGALSLSISSSADHWVVYDEPAHAVCVEPQSGPPDVLNREPPIVSPDAPLVVTARFVWLR